MTRDTPGVKSLLCLYPAVRRCRAEGGASRSNKKGSEPQHCPPMGAVPRPASFPQASHGGCREGCWSPASCSLETESSHLCLTGFNLTQTSTWQPGPSQEDCKLPCQAPTLNYLGHGCPSPTPSPADTQAHANLCTLAPTVLSAQNGPTPLPLSQIPFICQVPVQNPSPPWH